MRFDIVEQCSPFSEEVEKTIWVEMPELGPDAAVEVVYSGEENVGYLNAMLRLGARRQRGKKKKPKGGEADVAEMFAALVDNRDDDRKMYPAHIMRGWRNIPGRVNDGDPVTMIEFSREAALEFCEVLPVFLMDRMRESASNPRLFIEPFETPDPDPAELAEN